MKATLRFFLIAFFLGLIPFSCERCVETSCGGCDTSSSKPVYRNYVQQYNAEVIASNINYLNQSSFDHLSFPVNNIDTNEFYAESDVVLFLFGSYASERVSSLFNFNLTNTLYACSPSTPQFNSPIKKLILKAEQSFYYNEDFPVFAVGEAINDLFLIGGLANNRAVNKIEPTDIPSFLNTPQYYLNALLILNASVDTTVTMKFSCFVELEDTSFTIPHLQMKLER